MEVILFGGVVGVILILLILYKLLTKQPTQNIDEAEIKKAGFTYVENVGIFGKDQHYRKITKNSAIDLIYYKKRSRYSAKMFVMSVENPGKAKFELKRLTFFKPKNLQQKLGVKTVSLLRNAISTIKVDKKIELTSVWNFQPFDSTEDLVGHMEKVLLSLKVYTSTRH